MSDIVFLRSWFKIKLEKFYNPIVSYERMRLMRTTWELRKDSNMEVKLNPDSEYKQIERVEKKFNPLMLPKGLENNLPFQSKEKI